MAEQDQKIFCETCQGEINVIPPPLPPQMINGSIMSAVTMVNGRGECTKCGQKYVTQIAGIQINLGFAKVAEQPLVIPATPDQVPPVPPGLKLVK